MWGYGPSGMMGYGWGTGDAMMFFWLIVLALVIAAVVWMFRSRQRFGDDGWRTDRGPRGLDILEGRYARGEVSRDEYLQKKRDILGRGEAT
jgi:putative membrane protein